MRWRRWARPGGWRRALLWPACSTPSRGSGRGCCSAQNDVVAAARWMDERGVGPGDEPIYPREPEYLVLARVLLAQDRPAQALALLGRLHAAADAQGRTGSVIEIAALQALALAATGEEDAAVDALARALWADPIAPAPRRSPGGTVVPWTVRRALSCQGPTCGRFHRPCPPSGDAPPRAAAYRPSKNQSRRLIHKDGARRRHSRGCRLVLRGAGNPRSRESMR